MASITDVNDLQWTTPPHRRGLIVEYSYASPAGTESATLGAAQAKAVTP